jgi:hypothetical protein
MTGRLCDRALPLRGRQRGRRLEVEHSLDPRFGALGVLTARAARAGKAQLDLAEGESHGSGSRE